MDEYDWSVLNIFSLLYSYEFVVAILTKNIKNIGLAKLKISKFPDTFSRWLWRICWWSWPAYRLPPFYTRWNPGLGEWWFVKFRKPPKTSASGFPCLRSRPCRPTGIALSLNLWELFRLVYIIIIRFWNNYLLVC